MGEGLNEWLVGGGESLGEEDEREGEIVFEEEGEGDGFILDSTVGFF